MNSPLGRLALVAQDGGLAALSFLDYEGEDRTPPLAVIDETPSTDEPARLVTGRHSCQRSLLEEAAMQLSSYFAGRLRQFDLPLTLDGSSFQRRVWQELMRVPWGSTASYGEIASYLGQAGAARAVGGANNRNPLPIVVPCHRIIGCDGKLVGYNSGLEVKAWLLRHEGFGIHSRRGIGPMRRKRTRQKMALTLH